MTCADSPKAAALGVWVSVNVSGGHINPAVCLHAYHSEDILICPRVSLAGNARHGSLQGAALVQSLHLHPWPDNRRVAGCTHRLC